MKKVLITTAAMAFAIMPGVQAHMFMGDPVPFSNETLNNEHLKVDGSDYPCKLRNDAYNITKMNHYRAGESVKVSFRGTATHGGGSCQFSITTDKEPTKNTQFKVLHSVVGGCPSDYPGNLFLGGEGYQLAEYNIQLPKEIPDGQYTFVWTWFNKIGQREMYMNCAPIIVTGGAGDISVLKKLPDMYVMNLPLEECQNTEGEDMVFPEPGESKETGTLAKPGSKTVGSGCAAMTKKGAGAGTLTPPSMPTGTPTIEAQPPGTPMSGPALPPANPTLLSTYASHSTGGVPDSGRVGADTGKPASIPAHPTVPDPDACPNDPESDYDSTTVSQSPARPTAPAASKTPISPNPPTGGHSGVPCDKDGATVCIGDTQFGICSHGTATPQSLAAGTACKDGKIDHANKAADRNHPGNINHRHRRRHGHQLF